MKNKLNSSLSGILLILICSILLYSCESKHVTMMTQAERDIFYGISSSVTVDRKRLPIYLASDGCEYYMCANGHGSVYLHYPQCNRCKSDKDSLNLKTK